MPLSMEYFVMSPVKAKFHYATWSQTGPKLVADRFEAKFHYAIWSQTGPRLVADLEEVYY